MASFVIAASTLPKFSYFHRGLRGACRFLRPFPCTAIASTEELNMKAYKLEILVIDYDEVGEQGIIDIIANQKYPNYCINPHVMATTEADIGQWHDDHPMNKFSTMESEYERIFNMPDSDSPQ